MNLTGNPQITFFESVDFEELYHQNRIPDNQLLLDSNVDKWIIVYRIIDNMDQNNECPISLEIIKTGDSYCKCIQCKYNFCKEQLKISLDKNNRCPLCRTQWTDETVYVNTEKIDIDLTDIDLTNIDLTNIDSTDNSNIKINKSFYTNIIDFIKKYLT